MDIILASASPRRKELLSNIFSDFRCIPSEIDEVVPEETPLFEVPKILAMQKAEAECRNNGHFHARAFYCNEMEEKGNGQNG